MTERYFREVKSAFPSFDFTNDQVANLEACVNETITSEEAAWAITRYPEMAASPIEMHQRLGGLWTLFSDAAVHIPQAQDHIITLMQQIQKLPKGPEPDGEGKDHLDLDDGWYWRELTGWGSLWADDFNGYASQYLISTRPSSNKRASTEYKWTNACSFIARLTMVSKGPLSLLGEGLNMATIAITEALEATFTGAEPRSLEAAAQLFRCAGAELYRRCKDECSMRVGSKNDLCKGTEPLQRWRFWEQRWATIAGEENFPAETRATAYEALEDMDRCRTNV